MRRIHRWIPLKRASDAELWCFLWSAPWINGRVNNGVASDLRRHHTHYDVIVMILVVLGHQQTPGNTITQLVLDRHLPLDKMAAISQTTFSNTFLWMKSLYFDSDFIEVCLQGTNWQWYSIGSGNGLMPNGRQAITWTYADPVHCCVYAALGVDELTLFYYRGDEITQYCAIQYLAAFRLLIYYVFIWAHSFVLV